MVITLSGSVLFAFNQAVLLPEARSRLDQVAAALLSTRERKISVEGYTDSRGRIRTTTICRGGGREAVQRDYIVLEGL